MIGNLAYVSGAGIATPGWYQIISQVTSTSITVDRATGATTGTVNVNIGGALADPGQAFAIATVSGMQVYSKAGNYTLSTSTPGPGGPIAFTSGINLQWIGYDVVVGDHTGNRPSISWGAVAAPGALTYLCVMPGVTNLQMVDNVELNCNNVNLVGGFNGTGNAYATNSVVRNCTGTGTPIAFASASGQVVGYFGCQTFNCAISFQGNAQYATKCTAGSSGLTGTTGFNVLHAKQCLILAAATGFSMQNNAATSVECTADGCTTGFNAGGAVRSVALVDCMASNNTTGFTVGQGTVLINAATYGNGTAISGTPAFNLNPLPLTVQPYVTAGSQYAPNNAGGGGQSLRGAGVPIPGQTDNKDVGAVQHSDPSTIPIFQVEA